MARQLRIAGTERPDIPEELENASTDLIEHRREKRRLTTRINEDQYKVIAIMQAHKITRHVIKDTDTGEYLEFEVEMVAKLRTRKTDEVDSDDGEEVIASSGTGGIHPGLIAQAEKAQADMGVAESSDGDVVVPDTAAPKAKGKRGRKPKLEVVPDTEAE